MWYFNGIDLSCNNFTGEIPPKIGNLSKIKFDWANSTYIFKVKGNRELGSFIQQIGRRNPSSTYWTYSLAVFSVAHNNLSGKTPSRIAQFTTFEDSSYEDNPFLCGEPLTKACDVDMPSSPTSTNYKDKGGFMDMEVFYVSFGVAYIMVLLVIGAVLYINPYW
uniref:Uncharacterized protein n=1 Tax=Salix viminalis TaxID=40686 RepID=A0A6N2L4B5_SALVM